MLDKGNDEVPHAHQLGELLETSQVVTIDVASPEAVVIKELVAKGETVEPGFKIAIISKSGEGVAHVAPLEKIPEWATRKPSLAEKIKRRSRNRAVPQKWNQNLPRVGQFWVRTRTEGWVPIGSGSGSIFLLTPTYIYFLNTDHCIPFYEFIYFSRIRDKMFNFL
ncbi:dihydrolipoyllysine-residue succinyltransferase component of 2-oxoglutarate dehydrogenase complex 1, mitochondrial-like isoform X2 [Mangifera indica]|nr:dihydrolipoyllysine-residue succinyltransferase component of 2-oxoglutarate dehydrogenase complex 1, mitochondrial-like isoform X2 [Mangifera indica]XP_044476367.1 dihydrolipoyllysine-residue succinyltransferase component of 2-oxoglutarate dehydrogenase complex 1, mitochondrial-like isoform X2 [Mangifera indica]XP_044476368.1 dihydrolipoyllysine-residue succinyltransferase component of 2-oxoglutarate dehydrogenase complex 1, mitochondrial-like isoform X2 [Mangifera indica]XP_044476369.1 dihyd